MEVILIDDVFELGKRGQVVIVADGYGRNYLIPKKLAIPATAGNLKMIEQQRLAMAKKETKYKEEAELLAQELGQLHLIVSRKSGETGSLFGSVTSKDVGDLLEKNGIQLDRRKILLTQPIKGIGNYKIELRPHSDVAAELLLSVLIEGDEPVAKVKKKDEESEKIVAELEARIKEIEQLTSAHRSAAAESEEEETEEEETLGPEQKNKQESTRAGEHKSIRTKEQRSGGTKEQHRETSQEKAAKKEG